MTAVDFQDDILIAKFKRATKQQQTTMEAILSLLIREYLHVCEETGGELFDLEVESLEG